MSGDATTDTMEKLQGYFTLALTVAARIMEVQMHRKAQETARARAASEQEGRRAEQQLRAEVTVTKHQLRDVGGKEWWDKAAPVEVAAAYATARAYGEVDPELAGTARFMAEEIGKRYGVDADELVRTTSRTDAWMSAVGTDAGMEASEATRRQVEERQRQASIERGEAVALVAEADVVDHAARVDGVITPHEAGVELPDAAAGWDAAARREALADRLTAVGAPFQPEATEARLVADQLQGRPAAVTPAAHGHGKPPHARNVPTRGQERVRGR